MIKASDDHVMLPEMDRDDSWRERQAMADYEVRLTEEMLMLLYRMRSIDYATVKVLMIPIEADVWYKFGFRI